MLTDLKIFLVFFLITTALFASDSKEDESQGVTQCFPLSLSPSIAETQDCYGTLDTVYERVIGLGKNCLTKAQINLFFNPQGDHFSTKPGQADLLDWVSIEDYSLLIESLEKGFDNFFQKESFKVTIPSHFHLTDTNCGVRWVHLLSNYIQSVPENSKNDPNFLLQTFQEKAYDQEKSKIDYLKKKFINAKNKNTIYILSKEPALPWETVLKLRNALTILREGNKNFMMLLVSQQKIYDDFENIIVRHTSNVNETYLVEPDQAAWSSIFKEFKFSPTLWQ